MKSSGEDLPVVMAFGMVKHSDVKKVDGAARRDPQWCAFAVEMQGEKVVRREVIELDRDRDHVRFRLDDAMHRWFSYGESPFPPEPSDAEKLTKGERP